MKVTAFDRDRDLIMVRAYVWGPHGRTRLSLALDTGSAMSVVAPQVLDELGYNPRDGEAITTVRTAVGKELGYTLRVSRFAALGYELADHPVHVFDLATGHDLDGLIGLNFLRHFDYEVRSAACQLRVAPTAT